MTLAEALQVLKDTTFTDLGDKYGWGSGDKVPEAIKTLIEQVEKYKICIEIFRASIKELEAEIERIRK